MTTIPGEEAPADAPRATWRALAAACALVTDKLTPSGASRAELTADVPPGEVIAVLVTITARALLMAMQPDAVASLIRDLGLVTAAELAGCGGEGDDV